MVEVGVGEVGQRLLGHRAGNVDGDVDPTLPGHHRLEQAVHVGGDGGVGAYRFGVHLVPAQPGHGLSGRVGTVAV